MAADERVTWIEGAEGCWRMGVLAPGPRLAGCVKALTCYVERWPGPVSRRQVATSGAVVFVTWGTPLEVSLGETSSSFSAFVSGVQDRSANTRHAGMQEGIGVHLNALGVSRLIGLPGAELANRCVTLDEILGHGAETLMDRLSGVATPSRRMALVEATLVERLGAAPILSPEVVWVWGTLCSQPSARIADLAVEVAKDGGVRFAPCRPAPPPRVDGHLVAVTSLERSAPHLGERHPDGDELIYLLSGEVTVVIEAPRGDERHTLGPGDALIVARGLWHRIEVTRPARLVHLTPGPSSEHRPASQQPKTGPR